MTMKRQPTVVGIDIGGANLKYWSSDGHALATPFPLWKSPDRLAAMLAQDLQSLGRSYARQSVDIERSPRSGERSYIGARDLAVTMTGELADCFADRRAGVQHILEHVVRAADEISIGTVVVYSVDGRLLPPRDAAIAWESVASANWHALATQVASEFPEAAMLIDIGSTTTDLIPLAGGRVATLAKTDHDRLVEGSLVYVGCRRTPVCSLVDSLVFRGRNCPVMNEVFATIDDARLLTESIPPDPTDCDTADGAPRTVESAGGRMARMIGLDAEDISKAELRELAEQVTEAAVRRIAASLTSLPSDGCWIVAGHGDDLIPDRCSTPPVELTDCWGGDAARCAPSRAVARLYQHQMQGEQTCAG